MHKILVGWLALVFLAVVVGASTHWVIGVAIAVVPVAVVYMRLKLSPTCQAATDIAMTKEETLKKLNELAEIGKEDPEPIGRDERREETKTR